MRMNYQPAVVREYGTGAEMRASYKAGRARLYDDATAISALRATLAYERLKHADDIQVLEARIGELKATIEKLRQEDPGAVIDRAKYSYPNVLKAICRVYGVSTTDIKGPDRRFHISRARMHLVHLLTVNRPDLSSPMIGSLINRDHSTILNGRNRWPAICERIKWAIPLVEREIEALSVESLLITP
jgi:hypothetical protein